MRYNCMCVLAASVACAVCGGLDAIFRPPFVRIIEKHLQMLSRCVYADMSSRCRDEWQNN
jgi:hypothetical protein